VHVYSLGRFVVAGGLPGRLVIRMGWMNGAVGQEVEYAGRK
jgi:hypothetical protein